MFDRNLFQLKGMGGVMGALFVLALLQAAAVIGQMVSLARAIALLWDGAPLADAAPLICTFFACFAMGKLVQLGQETMLDRYAQARAGELQERLLGRVFDAQTLLARREGSGAVAVAATEGIDEIERYIRIMPPKVIGMVAISIPVLVVEFATDWPSGIILAVMFPVIIFFMILLGRQARARAEKQFVAYQRLSNRFIDTLRGLGAIAAAGAGQVEGRSVRDFSEQLRRATVRTLTTATLSSAVLDLCATFGVGAVAMMLAFRIMDGSVALATGLTALMLAPEYFAPIRAFASDFHASLDGKNALAASLGYLNDAGPAAPGASAEEDAEPPAGIALAFEDVSFAYTSEGGELPVIGGVSFRVREGEHVAITGPSGAGKSTLAALAAGLISPTGGRVLAAGRTLFIPQAPYIFHATLEDNVRFYQPDAPRSAVQAAIAAVGLERLAAELPEGLDTVIGAGAHGLSGGQAHRVAIARALLCDDARTLVLDEPTAHLDLETEYDLKRDLLPLLEGRTVLFATHRLHWLADMDRAIRIDGGRIV